jgi:hypothetical protein
MKKLGMLLMLFSLCTFTVGCGGGNGATDSGNGDAAAQPDDAGDGASADEGTDSSGG